MLRLIVDEARLVVGHMLQTIAMRVIPQPPMGLPLLEGDRLTCIGLQYGCERETDTEYRERVAAVARGKVGDNAEYRPAGVK